MSDTIYAPARKIGRCFNGFERDGGTIIHAVEPLPSGCNGDWFGKALCGTEPGRRGNGWGKTDKEINCALCLKKMNKNQITLTPNSNKTNTMNMEKETVLKEAAELYVNRCVNGSFSPIGREVLKGEFMRIVSSPEAEFYRKSIQSSQPVQSGVGAEGFYCESNRVHGKDRCKSQCRQCYEELYLNKPPLSSGVGAEEILAKHLDNYKKSNGHKSKSKTWIIRVYKNSASGFTGMILKAMEEYAAQFKNALQEYAASGMRVIEFSEWCSENFKRTYPTQQVYEHKEGEVLWHPKITWDLKFENRIYKSDEIYKIWLDESPTK